MHCIFFYCIVCIVLYRSVLFLLYCNALYLFLLYFTALYCCLLYSTALYCTALSCCVLYCIALYFIAIHLDSYEMRKNRQGRPYYLDHYTKTTSWERPTSLPPGYLWRLRLQRRPCSSLLIIVISSLLSHHCYIIIVMLSLLSHHCYIIIVMLSLLSHHCYIIIVMLSLLCRA